MNELVLADRAAEWRRLKSLVLDSVSSPITRRVYNLGLDEFFAWYEQEPRPGFTKATVAAWRVALEAWGLGAVSINVRITAVRKLAVEAADNGLLAPEFQIREGFLAEFRAEAFGAFNSPRFGNPTNSATSSQFGIVTLAQANAPRSIQLSLRLSF